jgi:hypothetical protein
MKCLKEVLNLNNYDIIMRVKDFYSWYSFDFQSSKSG